MGDMGEKASPHSTRQHGVDLLLRSVGRWKTKRSRQFLICIIDLAPSWPLFQPVALFQSSVAFAVTMQFVLGRFSLSSLLTAALLWQTNTVWLSFCLLRHVKQHRSLLWVLAKCHLQSSRINTDVSVFTFPHSIVCTSQSISIHILCECVSTSN